MKFKIVVLLSLVSFSLYALEDMDREELQKRIQPVGNVQVQEQNDTTQDGTNNKAAAPVTEKKEPGQSIYEQYCIVCHKDGLAGAPKFRNAADWKTRLAGKKIEDLVGIVTNGLNAMPPKGTCTECSDSDLKDAIQYMLPKS